VRQIKPTSGRNLIAALGVQQLNCTTPTALTGGHEAADTMPVRLVIDKQPPAEWYVCSYGHRACNVLCGYSHWLQVQG